MFSFNFMYIVIYMIMINIPFKKLNIETDKRFPSLYRIHLKPYVLQIKQLACF